MSIATLILEYLKVLLSAPVIIGGGAIAVVVIFREDLKALLLRVASIKFPGGEVVTSHSRRQEEEKGENAARPLPNPDPIKLPHLPPQQREAMENMILGERANAYLWEYRYLNHFLVFRTQQVLDWLASKPQPVPVQLYTSIWLPVIPSVEERTTVLAVLSAHFLVQLLGTDAVEVSPKGREYLAWRGPLPQLSTAGGSN